MIDSHCHLADRKFNKDLSEVLLRAEENGVDAMVCIADDLKEGKRCIELAEQYPQIFCTIGVHPHVSRFWSEGSAVQLEKMVHSSEKVKAVGEIGLDYHYDNSPRDVQRRVFSEQLILANDWNMPVVIHCRDAIDDVMTIINDAPPEKAVLHCSAEEWGDSIDWVERGYLLGFTGIATYPKSEHIREVIKNCPLNQMMIETDSPYLSPEGYRGKRCEPAFVMEVAKLISKIKGIDLSEVDRQTTENAVELYGL